MYANINVQHSRKYYKINLNRSARDCRGYFLKHPVNITRNSADADKPRDTFRGQSRSPNIVPYDMLGMVWFRISVL